MAEKDESSKKAKVKSKKAADTVNADAVETVEVADKADVVAEEKKPSKKATTKTNEKDTKTTKKSEKSTRAEGNSKGKVKNKLSAAEKRHSKKYRTVETLIEKDKEYTPEEAVGLAKKTSTTKFDSSVEVHFRLNIDPQNSEQQIRGSLVLPHGSGKSKKICAIVSPEKDKEAKDAGADFVGSEDLIAKIEKGWLDFEIVVATPDMMPKLGKIGKILGTKGLMPNPKVGTVTPNVGKVIKDIKKGMIEYRVDKNGIVHTTIGKVSFDEKALLENYNELYSTIVRVKPSGVKGTYIKSISISTTMGPGIRVLAK